MVNEDYEPDAVEDTVIAVLRDAERANPYLIRERAGDLSKQQINNALRNLTAAGWVRKVTRGLYDYVEDPRVSEETEPAQRAADSRESPAVSRARDALADWEPEDVDSVKARRATIAVVEWLAQQDAPQQRADVLAWAEGREMAYAPSTLWDKVVQPGLAALVDRGVVEWKANVGYAIVEEEEE
jgi:hypothetical protein